MDIASHPDLLDMIEQIIGLDIILWGSGIFYKRELAGPATPWHRDSVYTPIRPLATTTVWIAVFDSVVANGCLRVIPGSHRTKARTPWSGRFGPSRGSREFRSR
jgi:ectoine hydroxylase-related dioxygenase (phytanoyl-CoA dioxygenase family)